MRVNILPNVKEMKGGIVKSNIIPNEDLEDMKAVMYSGIKT